MGVCLFTFDIFYCPGYRGMYVQGVSSKSFKQNAAGEGDTKEDRI